MTVTNDRFAWRLADSQVDRDAVEAFWKLNPDLVLNPVCVVIPAFEEEESIGHVLDSIPGEVAGLETSVVVISDGCTDRTVEVAAQHGALVCSVAVNRGQGAALRLGYRLAREAGARYVVTVDADGQWHPSEMARLVQPLIQDSADFVQGSRRLGSAANDDKVRATGVLVFAALVSLLSGTSITDSSSGFRAMRAEVLDDILLEQDQYQAAELLIAVIARGYRVAERPVTMSARHSGKSKKGSNLIYGARYAKVILRTWWRERRRTS